MTGARFRELRVLNDSLYNRLEQTCNHAGDGRKKIGVESVESKLKILA